MRIYTDTVTTSANAATTGAVRTPFVSLLSDFGSRDPSAGIMRAVVAGICPEANVVDISHDVDKFSIRDGALLLWSAAPYLPIGAHVAARWRPCASVAGRSPVEGRLVDQRVVTGLERW